MSNSVTRQRVVNESLLEYARKNRDEGFFNDLIIITDNDIIHANRLVLSFHSSYFEGMFKTMMRQETVLEIDAVDGESMKALIDYIYIGSITISNENVKCLLSAAEYLKLHDVTQFCIEFLHSNLTPDNSLDILKGAILCQNEAIKEEMQQYIAKNLDQVMQTDKFKALSKVDLISCISNLDRIRAKETSIYQAVITWTHQMEDVREIDLSEVFKMINLERVSIEFMENVVLKENLVSRNPDCHKFAWTTFCNLAKAEKFNTNGSHLISLGGTCTRHKVTALFNISHETEKNYADFDRGLESHCSVKYDNCVYSIGGKFVQDNDLLPTEEVVKIDLTNEAGKWENVASMNKKRYAMGASIFCGTIFVAGGANKRSRSSTSSEFYIPALNEWKNASSLKQRRSGHALVSCGGNVYAIGGWASGCYLFSAERLNDLNAEWRYIQPMQTSRRWLAAVSCGDVIFAIGGQSDEDRATTLNTVEKYDAKANTWSYVCDMNLARGSHAACVLRGKIYVVGGINACGDVVKEIESYDPVNDTWNVEGKITDELYSHNLVAA